MHATHAVRRAALSSSMVLALAATGCASSDTKDDSPPTQQQVAAETPSPATTGEQAMPDDDVHKGAAHGEGSPAGREDGAVYLGVVQEAMNAGGYTYLRVQLDSGDEQWVAIEEAAVAVGERVSVKVSMRMSNFPSIWFGYVEPVSAPAGGMDDTI
jgi:outer membrane lipoprotein SlyB